jgi:hypothetical protein
MTDQDDALLQDVEDDDDWLDEESPNVEASPATPATSDDEADSGSADGRSEVERLNALSDREFDKHLATLDREGYPSEEESEALIGEFANLSEADWNNLIDPPSPEQIAEQVDREAAAKVEAAREAAIEARMARAAALVEANMRRAAGLDQEQPSEADELAKLHESTAIGRMTDDDFARLAEAADRGLSAIPERLTDGALDSLFQRVRGDA